MSEWKKPFWFVWNHGGTPPTTKHNSRANAIEEAERLAKKHPERLFVVLESVCAIEAVGLLHTDLRPVRDRP